MDLRSDAPFWLIQDGLLHCYPPLTENVQLRGMFSAADVESEYAWAGSLGETKDGLGYIGPSPEIPRAFFALGFGGNGITFSVVAARILRDLVEGRANDDARIFRFGR